MENYYSTQNENCKRFPMRKQLALIDRAASAAFD